LAALRMRFFDEVNFVADEFFLVLQVGTRRFFFCGHGVANAQFFVDLEERDSSPP